MTNENPLVVKVQNLSVDFKGQGAEIFHAVKNISFEIYKGRTTALVGESGSGKSVTAMSILQLLPYPMARHPQGSITIDGVEMVGAEEDILLSVRGHKVGMIFQEPMTSLNPLHTIERQIAEPLFLHQKNMTKTKARARVLELLDLVGLERLKERLNSFPHELSGGQRQRVMIAMALANEPDLLIADEPTTALDVTVQAQILELLQNLQKKMGMAILMITHDLGVVRKMAHHVCVMQQGEIVESSEKSALFANPRHDYTKMLLAAEPKGITKALSDKAEILYQADNVKVHFPVKAGLMRRTVDVVKAVDDVSLSVYRGETVGVVGESGSGKTTLGLSLLRLNESQGRKIFMGKDLSNLSAKELRHIRSDLQIVFQDPFGSLSPRMSVQDIIAEGLAIHEPELSRAEREQRVIKALEDVRMDPQTRHRYPHEFSGGQRQRISIARALILQPEMIVMDEPTSALDVSIQAQIVELLRDLQERYGLSYVFISHDLKVVRALAHRILVMKDGKIVEQGATEDIFIAPRQDYTKALIKAAFDLAA